MQQDPAPQHVVVTPVGQTDVIRSNREKLRWGLICLIAPTALFILSLVGYALVNLLASEGAVSLQLRTITNILLYLVGMVVVLTWLPGLIVGIVLLATRKKVN
jgi:hypothetical protein